VITFLHSSGFLATQHRSQGNLPPLAVFFPKCQGLMIYLAVFKHFGFQGRGDCRELRPDWTSEPPIRAVKC